MFIEAKKSLDPTLFFGFFYFLMNDFNLSMVSHMVVIVASVAKRVVLVDLLFLQVLRLPVVAQRHFVQRGQTLVQIFSFQLARSLTVETLADKYFLAHFL